MSFEILFDNIKKTKERLTKKLPPSPYPFVDKMMERSRACFGFWSDLNQVLAEGFSKMLLGEIPKTAGIMAVTSMNILLEKQYSQIAHSHITPEVYLLLRDFIMIFGAGIPSFAIAEGEEFEQWSINTAISEMLRKVKLPEAINMDDYKRVMKNIHANDVGILSYERGQHENVLCWPLLLHEVFHSIYATRGLSRLEKRLPKESWITEALIDYHVLNFFGPAYATSLAMKLSRYPHGKTPYYPSWIARLVIASCYLQDLKDEKAIPSSFLGNVSDSLKYVENVYQEYEKLEPKKSEIERLYEVVGETVQPESKTLLSSQAMTFTEFLSEVEKRRQEVFRSAELEEYPIKQVFSIDDVVEYYHKKIPIAVDSRILFNSFLSERYLKEGISIDFVKDSLRKNYIRRLWPKAKADALKKRR